MRRMVERAISALSPNAGRKPYCCGSRSASDAKMALRQGLLVRDAAGRRVVEDLWDRLEVIHPFNVD